MTTDTRAWARIIFDGERIEGDAAFHLSALGLAEALVKASKSFVGQSGELEAIVVRCPDGSRDQPVQTRLSVDEGLLGDRWATGKAKPGDQVSMMNLEVAASIANGQSIALFGDNLFTRLDIREHALPVGSQLRIGKARLEVSAEPHMPCSLFRSRFGPAAFQLASKEPRLRGVYLTVIESGEIALGDPVIRA